MITKKCDFQQKKHLKLWWVIAFFPLTMLALSFALASAQGEPGVNQQLLAAIGLQIGENMQALTGCSYQQRTEVQVKGETKSVQLVQVAFGPDKQPLITPISAQPSEDTGRGLRGRIKEKKIEEMKEEVQRLVQLSDSYLKPKQEKLQQLIRQGQVWLNPDSGSIRVDISGIQQMGDHMTMNCDGKTKNVLQTQV